VGKVIGRPSVFLVGSKEEAKQQVKTLARKLYGLVNKTAATVCLALAIPFEQPKQVSNQAEVS